MADIPEFVAQIARALADDPDEVRVETQRKGRRNVVELRVATDDMGRVIGRNGRVANAIRTVLTAAPQGDGPWSLEVKD